MQIIFKTPAGRSFQATLEDDKLKDIRPVEEDGGQSKGRPGGGVPSPETQPQEMDQKPEEPESGNGGSEVSKEDRVFIEQLKAVLVNNRARKQLRHKQKGLLDGRSLVKTQMDRTSVFRQNNRKDSERNYSVVLLVDESGSMGGEKAQLAQELTQSITTSLDQVGGVEVAVIGFSGNRVVEHKRFDNTGKSSMCCIERFVRHDSHCSTGRQINAIKETDGQNADLIAMEYALNYLSEKSSPNSKQVFIMLSDGSPCSSNSHITVISSDIRSTTFNGKFTNAISGSTDDVSNMHKLLRMFPDITSFGLGMLQGGQQVPQHVVVKDIKQTKGVLLNFLRTTIS